VLGRNGSGKSTLMRILAGVLSPDAGEVQLGARVRAGYYPQEGETLNGSLTAIEICRDSTSDETAARTLLGCLKLSAERATRPVSTLSAGERAKVAMARLLLSEANLLLLDEPTNHLDIDAIEALEPALARFPGAIVFASHDRAFIDALGGQVLDLGQGDYPKSMSSAQPSA
jgi:ATP-binding cassette subfamily F protein 3